MLQSIRSGGRGRSGRGVARFGAGDGVGHHLLNGDGNTAAVGTDQLEGNSLGGDGGSGNHRHLAQQIESLRSTVQTVVDSFGSLVSSTVSLASEVQKLATASPETADRANAASSPFSAGAALSPAGDVGARTESGEGAAAAGGGVTAGVGAGGQGAALGRGLDTTLAEVSPPLLNCGCVAIVHCNRECAWW